MIAGQDLSFTDTLIIAVIGLIVVMVALGFLALFVKIMSSILVPFLTTTDANKAPAAPSTAMPPADDSLSEDLAVIMAAVCQESRIPMEQIVFKSIRPLD